MSKAIYCGSFNPFHLGHYDIIYRAAMIFDELRVLIAQNSDKAVGHTSIEAIEKDVADIGNVIIMSMPPPPHNNELLVSIAERFHADCLIRGVRGVKDFEAELEMADINLHLSSVVSNFEMETLFLVGNAQFRHISSSMIRGLPKNDRWEAIIREFMPKHSAKEFIERNSK